MRLGINGNLETGNPEEWIKKILELKLKAAVFPIDSSASEEEITAYQNLAEEHDIVIGEVGVWNNVMDMDETKRKKALEYAKKQLAFADQIGANCCVNIAGARGDVWDGFYDENYTKDTYAMILDVTREIIDAVGPKHTYFTLEPMYWMHPDSPEDYLQLIKDVDRKRFGVHMDYANMITGFQKYLYCDDFVKECFRVLGPYVRSVHAKDVILKEQPPITIHETFPGTGRVNLGLVMKLSHELNPDIPVFVEHLSDMTEYVPAIQYMQKTWRETR